MQVEVGMVKITPPTTTAFVLAEYWPLASFVARSLGCSELHTYVERSTVELVDSLKQGGLEDSLLSMEELQDCILATASRRAQCWIHGSETFVESLLPWICKHSHLDMYFVISDSSGRQKLKSAILQRDFTWLFLTHKEVGGILHGGWKIGARTWRDLAEIRTRSKVTPEIRDYVSSIVSGQETPELSYAEAKQAGLLANMDLLPRTGILHQNI